MYQLLSLYTASNLHSSIVSLTTRKLLLADIPTKYMYILDSTARTSKYNSTNRTQPQHVLLKSRLLLENVQV